VRGLYKKRRGVILEMVGIDNRPLRLESSNEVDGLVLACL
jgi:hypothetical protein